MAPSLPPLPERMRPQSLDEIVGQESVLGPDAPFGRMLRSPGVSLPSVVLWGPPGVGKTSIAKVIAQSRGYRFVRLSGVLDGVKEIRQAVEEAEAELQRGERRTVALVDEIHRFNRSQQDAFLPHVESGLLTVIGQTTENVSFRIRGALLSRMQVVRLNPLEDEAVGTLLERALRDTERGLGAMGLMLTPDAKKLLSRLAAGDARRGLTTLEWAAVTAQTQGESAITEEGVRASLLLQPPPFDQEGDYHYDTISAFIKSLRGSDPDAALYYLIRALEGGEDPLFLTRRMIIFASEDASADPRALEIALNVDRAVERVGMPEGRIALAHGVCYLACCAKSNASYKALREMEQIVARHPDAEIPLRLRNAPTELMKELGHSLGYRYPHDYPGGFVPERYLPDELKDLEVYQPTDRALDAQIRERLRHYRTLIAEARITEAQIAETERGGKRGRS